MADQAFRVKTLALANATLSGGMRSATATGTRPARLVEAADKSFASIASTTSVSTGIAMDPDGLHFWFSDSVNNRVRKIKISDGSTVTTYTSNASDGGTRNITTPSGLTRFGNLIFCANRGANNYIIVIDTVNNWCRLYSNSLVTAPSHVVSGAALLCWVRAGTGATTGTYNEMSLSGTGDSAAAVAAGGARTKATQYDVVADEAGTYLYFTDGATITRYKLSDSSTTTLVSIGPAVQGAYPRYGNNWRLVGFDRVQGTPLFATNIATWWRCKADVTAFDALAFGMPTFGAPYDSAYNATSYSRQPFDISADGSGMIHWEPNPGAAITELWSNARWVNLGLQRARWSWTPGVAVKLMRFAVPGYFGNQLGSLDSMPTSPPMNDEHNFKRVKFYYSLDGGSTRYEVDSGADNTLYADGRPLSVTAAQTVTIDADIQRSIYHPLGPRPFIGGPGGEGPAIYYSKPDPSQRVIGGRAL